MSSRMASGMSACRAVVVFVGASARACFEDTSEPGRSGELGWRICILKRRGRKRRVGHPSGSQDRQTVVRADEEQRARAKRRRDVGRIYNNGLLRRGGVSGRLAGNGGVAAWADRK